MTRHLHLVAPSFLLGLGLASSSSLPAQQSTAAAPPARHSSVTFQNGLLTVQATNSSLNSVLHEVAQSTGMKISGSVPEDRVFGTYGPADPQHVLSTLLDGTGVNVLIVSNAAETPLELQLSPRSGAPSPPRPNQQAQEGDDTDAASQPADAETPESAPSRPARASAPPENTPPEASRFAKPDAASDPSADGSPSESSQPVVFPSISPNTPAATGTTTPANPDDDTDTTTGDVKTPQQIFEQLQKLQNNHEPASSTEPAPEQ